MSALLAIAAPHRIKTAHRRRRRCTVGQSVFRDYDPATGRYIESDPVGLDGGISTYGYVSASPLRSIDPLGLVEWTGTISYYQLGAVGTVGVYEAELTSQCVGGKRAKVKVRAGGGGVGVGLKRVPFASNQTPITLKDYLPSIRPENFNGLFFTMGAGFQFFGVGISCGGMQFGNHWTPAVTVGPMSCDTAGMGIDIGAGAIIGSSRLIGQPMWESCNDCSPVDTPFR